MKTIGIFTSNYGHESIAQAIAEKIKKEAGDKYRVKIFSRKLPLNFAYSSIYRLAPSSFGPPFRIAADIMKDKTAKKIVENWFLLNDKKTKNFITKNKIDLCINTFYSFNSTLEKFQEQGLPFINVLTDPKTIHPLIVSDKATLNLAFDNFIVKSFKNKNIKKSGWFVRNKFEKEYDRQTIRKKLHIENKLTFLITSGSEGSNTVLKILPSIINCEREVNFIVACGNNKFLYNSVLGIKKSLKKFSSSQATITPLGFTKNLHYYMQAADLVIGKAGPNTIFESVACETAFFAITHIHGQEDGNLEIIKDYKIGIVEENEKKANQKLTKLINNPQEIAAFAPNIKILKKYNQASIHILLKEMEKLLN